MADDLKGKAQELREKAQEKLGDFAADAKKELGEAEGFLEKALNKVEELPGKIEDTLNNDPVLSKAESELEEGLSELEDEGRKDAQELKDKL